LIKVSLHTTTATQWTRQISKFKQLFSLSQNLDLNKEPSPTPVTGKMKKKKERKKE
jgi:hypothetical protein